MGMSTTPASTRSRRPAGTPTGGQFAPEVHAEPEVELGATDHVDHSLVDDAPAVMRACGTVFHLRRDGVFPLWPQAMRFQFDRPLSPGEYRQAAQIIGYAYRATVAGESMGQPEIDSPSSFIVYADTTKTRRDDLGMAMEEFEDVLPQMLEEGTPVRSTNRAGPGTAGTRLVDGMGPIEFRIYYDDVWGDDEDLPPENESGTTYWRNADGQLHRTDGPAVERPGGGQEWWVNGQLHRTDGPAIEWPNGDRQWWVNGRLHRTDGPAFEWGGEHRSWWVNGTQFTEEEFLRCFGVIG